MAQIALYTVSSEEYVERTSDLLRDATERSTVVYVTTNKPANHLIQALDDASVDTDSIFFIDCISMYVGEEHDVDNCLLLDGPQNLTNLSIAIKKSLDKISGDRTLFFDSLSVLLMYNNADSVGKFSNFLINRMRGLEVETMIFALENDTDDTIISKISSFVDKVETL